MDVQLLFPYDIEDLLLRTITEIHDKEEEMVENGIRNGGYFAIVNISLEKSYYVQFCSLNDEKIQMEFSIGHCDKEPTVSPKKIAVQEERGWKSPDEEGYYNYWKAVDVSTPEKREEAAKDLAETIKYLYGYEDGGAVTLQVARTGSDIEPRPSKPVDLGEVKIEEIIEAFFDPFYKSMEALVKFLYIPAFIAFMAGMIWFFYYLEINNSDKFILASFFALGVILHGLEKYKVGKYDTLEEEELITDLMKTYENYKAEKFKEIESMPMLTWKRVLLTLIPAYFIGSAFVRYGLLWGLFITLVMWASLIFILDGLIKMREKSKY